MSAYKQRIKVENRRTKGRIAATYALFSSSPSESTDWRQAAVDPSHGWKDDTFGLPAALRYCLSNSHSLTRKTHAHNQSNLKVHAQMHMSSFFQLLLSYTNYTLAWGTHPHTDDLNASDQNSRLLASLSHLSSSLCFSHSLRHTVFGELELKNKSLALSWQQCTYVWDMPSLLFCWKGFLMFLL